MIGVIVFRSSFFCDDSHVYAAVAIWSILMTACIITLEFLITICSARGTIQDSRPRKCVPTLLHIRLAVFVLEILSLIVKTVLAARPGVLTEGSNCSDVGSAVIVSRVVVIVTWFIFFSFFVAVILYLDPCHCYSAKVDFEVIESNSREYNSLGDENGIEHNSIPQMVHRRWKLTHTVWEKRLRMMCCFAGSDESHEVAYKELAEIFASLFCDSNLVVSDIAAGLILVQKEHIEREEELRNQLNDPQRVEYSVPVDFSDPSDRQVFEDAVHFLKFALGTYTWPIYMYMNPCGCLNLCAHASICPCCPCCKKRTLNNIANDNTCFCGYAGLIEVTGLNEADIIYASFENDLFRAPFMVVLDHSHEAVVIAVRGTLSFQDLITDLTAQTHQIELPNQPTFHVHKGMYHTAAWIKQQLDDGILEEAFQKVPNYKLIVVGHSLGSGCACLLAMLYKEQYEDLKCFCYSPTGSLLNADAAYCTQSFVTSVTLGQDLVARLNIHTAHKLKEDVIRVLRRCRKPKYRILLEGLLETLGKCCGHHVLFKEDEPVPATSQDERGDLSPLLIPESDPYVYESFVTDSESEQDTDSSLMHNPPPQLYPPGRIIHIVDTMEARGGFFNDRRLEARWVSSSSFQRIIVSPDMVRDHFPDVITRAINAIWGQKKGELTEVQVESIANKNR